MRKAGKTKKSLKLIEIDLSKGREHEHPDIRTDGTQYLVKFSNDSGYHTGGFYRVWYGLNFDGWKGNLHAGMQFDTPGFNSSRWKRVWEIAESR